MSPLRQLRPSLHLPVTTNYQIPTVNLPPSSQPVASLVYRKLPGLELGLAPPTTGLNNARRLNRTRDGHTSIIFNPLGVTQPAMRHWQKHSAVQTMTTRPLAKPSKTMGT